MAEITLTFPPSSSDDFYVQHLEIDEFLNYIFRGSDTLLDSTKNEIFNDTYYPKGLVARRFSYKFHPTKYSSIFYGDDLMLRVSDNAAEAPRNKNELAALFGLIAYGELENKEASVKDLIETYIKPLILRYINGEARTVLQVAANKTDGEDSAARSDAETNQRSKNIDATLDLMRGWLASEDSYMNIKEKIVYWAGFLWDSGNNYPNKWNPNGGGYSEGRVPGQLIDFMIDGNQNDLKLEGKGPAYLLGFVDSIQDQFSEGFFSENPNGNLVNAFESTDADTTRRIADLANRFGSTTSPIRELKDDEDIIKMRQCILMTHAKAVEKHGRPYAPEWRVKGHKQHFKDSDGKVKILTERYASQNLFNTLINRRPFRDVWYSQQDTYFHKVMNKKLFWIYVDSNGDLQKTELFLTQDRLVEDYWDAFKSTSIFAFENEATEQQTREGLENVKNSSGALESLKNIRKGHYHMKSCKISYEGTNPSTARKDVTVTMEFSISSLASLELPISNRIIIDEEKEESTFIKLYNLITLPVTNKTNSRKGLGTLNPNAFDPDWSRVRLVVYDSPEDESSIVIDLSTIDHSISRESSTGACTLTINYRGYFEQKLQMPEFDVLANKEKREARKKIDREIEILKNSPECSLDALRKARKMELDYYKGNTAKIKAGRFVDDLAKRGLLYEYRIDAAKAIGQWNRGEDPSIDCILGIIKKDSLGSANYSENLEDEMLKRYARTTGSDGEESVTIPLLGWELYNKILGDEIFVGTYFYLGDLFDLAIDTVYSEEEKKKLDLTFIFGNINVDSPIFGGSIGTFGSNPLDFPVDVVVFMKWFERRVIAKKISFYPLTTFMRDLLQTLLVDLATKFCQYGVPEPPMYRSAFINSTETRDFVLDERGSIQLNNPFGDGEYYPILTRTPDQSSGYSDESSVGRNYCIFYQQTESRFQGVRYNEYETTPKIFYGIKNNKWNIVSDVTFNKTDAPFLREARYFNNNFGDLSLLSNVYNLSFSFKNRMANKDFYPGTIFEFILLDWGPEWNDEEPIQYLIDHDPLNYTIFGEANPHKAGTIANITGFGGYYIATKVEYNLGETNKDYEIKIDAMFIGANESVLMKRGELDKSVSQQSNKEQERECLEAIRRLTTTTVVEEEETPGILDIVTSAITPGLPSVGEPSE